MARDYDSVDCFWSSRGDYCIDAGDIKDTENDPLRSLYQELRTRQGSDQGDWSLNPNLGSSISDFIGYPSNKQTAESIKTRLIACLTRDGYINSNDIEIKYIPISNNTIMFRTKIYVQPTLKNGNSEYLILQGLYNSEENQVSNLLWG